MSIIKAEYRFTLYAARSEDPTEATVLAPIGGAAHSENFQVTTEFGGATGWKPYLGNPKCSSRGRLDPLMHKTALDQFTIDVQDAKVASSNTVRWVTAFMGDAKGRNRFKGLKAEILERLTIDGVAGAWEDYFIGRVDRVEKQNPSQAGPFWRFFIASERKDETRNVFVGPPHSSITYAYPCPLLPIGLQDRGDGLGWGGNPTTARATGTIDTITNGARVKVSQSLGNRLKITSALAAALDSRLKHPDSAAGPYNITPNVRCRLKRLDTSAEGDFWLLPFAHASATAGYDGEVFSPLFHDSDGRVTSFGIIPITAPNYPNEDYPADAHPYKYMAVPENGTAVNFYLYWAGPPTRDAPLLIDDVDPLTLWKDLLDAKFSDLYFGEVKYRPIRYSSAVFSALAGKFPNVRGLVYGTEDLNEWLEKYILRATHAVARVNASGEVEPADIRLPSDPSSLDTITNADYIQNEREGPDWKMGEDALTGVLLTQESITSFGDTVNQAVRSKEVPLDFPPHGLLVQQQPAQLFASELFADVEPKTETVECRFVPSLLKDTGFPWTPEEASREYLSFFGSGAAVLRLPCRRTTVTNKRPGDFVKVEVTAQPDPLSNELGGTRVMLVLDRYEREDGSRFLELLDGGPDSISTPPTGTAPTLNATIPKHAIDQAVTLNAALDPVEIWIAITTTAVGTRPAANSLLWRLAYVSPFGGTIVLPGLPAGRRIWTRFRCRAVGKLPSAFAFPSSGLGYVDTTALAPPSAVTATASNRSIVLTWTNGESDLGIVPVLDGSDVPGKPLKPGSTRYVFDELAASTSYTIGVRHVDAFGGTSATVTDTESTGTAATLPAPRSLLVTQGRGSASPVSLPPVRMVLRTGLSVRWSLAELHATTRVQLSTDPTFATINVDEYFEQGVIEAMLETPLDSTIRYVRARHERAGSTDSAWTSTVSAYPTLLVVFAGPDGFAGGSASLSRDADGQIRLDVDFTTDPDADRFYYELTRDGTWATVDESDSFLTRAQMPYSEIVTVGGSTFAAPDEIRLVGRFWNSISGFGEGVLDFLPGNADDASATLQDFRESRGETTVTYSWTRGGAVETVWVFDLRRENPSGADPWPSESDLPVSILAAGTDTYAAEIPPPGYLRYLQFEPRTVDLGIGPVERAIVSPTLDPPDELTNLKVAVNDNDGSVVIRVEAVDRTLSYRYAYTIGSLPAWPSDTAVELGLVRTITGDDAFTLPAGTLAYDQRIRVRAAPYINADGTGTDGASDHGDIRAGEDIRLKPPVELDVTTESESGTTGSFGVTVRDATGLSTALYYKKKSGSGAWSAWTLKSSSPADGVQYTETVTLMEDHQSFVVFRLDYTYNGDTLNIVQPSGAFDRGQIPQGSIRVVINENNDTASVDLVGDFDTGSWKALASTAGMPTDAAVRASGTVYVGRTIQASSVGPLVSGVTVGQRIYAKALAYSNAGGGGNESSAAMTAEAVYKVLAPILEITTETEVGAVGTFGVTVRDAGGQADALYYAIKSGTGGYGSWILKSSSPADNTQYTETVALIEDHHSQIKFRLDATLAGDPVSFPLESGAFDIGKIPDGSITLGVSDVGSVTASLQGDFDTASWKVAASTSGMPSDATVRAQSAQNGRIVTATGILTSVPPGTPIYAKAFAYSATGAGGNESTTAIQTQYVRATANPPKVMEDLQRSGTSATLTLTIRDEQLKITAVEFDKREGDAATTGWVSSWDSTSGTVGSSQALTRAEGVAVTAGKDSEIRWRVTYTDELGTSRTIGNTIPISNLATLTKKIRIPHTAFLTGHNPLITPRFLDYTTGYARPETVNQTNAFASVVLPKGVTITEFNAFLYRNGVGDVAIVDFYRVSATGTGTLLATVTHATTGWATCTASLSETVGDDTYMAYLTLTPASNVDHARISQVEPEYSSPAYSKVY